MNESSDSAPDFKFDPETMAGVKELIRDAIDALGRQFKTLGEDMKDFDRSFERAERNVKRGASRRGKRTIRHHLS